MFERRVSPIMHVFKFRLLLHLFFHLYHLRYIFKIYRFHCRIRRRSFEFLVLKFFRRLLLAHRWLSIIDFFRLPLSYCAYKLNDINKQTKKQKKKKTKKKKQKKKRRKRKKRGENEI